MKVCEVCGARMERRPKERPSVFRNRRACSALCARRLPRLYPNGVGPRPLVARTCIRCGSLKGAECFHRVPEGWSRVCYSCEGAKVRAARTDVDRESFHEMSERSRRERQSKTAPAANHGKEWTGVEMELVATRRDLTAVELAQMLGRTYHAVKTIRTRLNRLPRDRRLAGVD